MSATRIAGLVFVLLASCGGEEEHGDCRDEELSCFEPFECRAADQAPDDYGCFSAADSAPSCTGTPAGQVVPFTLESGTDIPLHWMTDGGPIEITYSSEFTGDRVDPRIVDGSWDSHSCAIDLFGPVTSNPVAPEIERAERRIHFQLTQLSGPRANTQVFYERGTGRILSATIDIDPDFASSIRKGELLALLGLAVGLGAAPVGADSVMAPDSSLDTESTLDVEAFCVLYGTAGSYCGD